MPISATSTFELATDVLIRRALQLAGLLNSKQQLDADDGAMMRDFLGMELQAWQADGTAQKWITRTTVTLTAATASKALPTDVLDVCVSGDRFVGDFTDENQKVYACTRDEYERIANRTTTTGVPQRVFIERGNTGVVTLWFYPVPTSALVLNYRPIRTVRDATTGEVTLDIPRVAQKALLYAMAHYACAAKNAPPERISYFERLSRLERDSARGWDRERAATQFIPSWKV